MEQQNMHRNKQKFRNMILIMTVIAENELHVSTRAREAF